MKLLLNIWCLDASVHSNITDIEQHNIFSNFFLLCVSSVIKILFILVKCILEVPFIWIGHLQWYRLSSFHWISLDRSKFLAWVLFAESLYFGSNSGEWTQGLGQSYKCSLIKSYPALKLSCSISYSQIRPANYATLLSGADDSHLLSKHNRISKSPLSFCFYCLLEGNQLIFATVENIIWAIKHDFNGCYL